ncbi:MAG: FadR family transcriptional regulator [Deltaproteobacteria bacterium]|nr:FadR family transcriptional regulator [Deltaproteobacteria bacterium]
MASTAADALRLRILTGRYLAGQTLPGERELSDELGVSRLTLRSAIAHLEAEGLLRAVHGSGTRVLDFRQTGGLDLFGHLASLVLSGAAVPGGLDLFASLMELRRAVAIEAVGLATERASADELRAMRAHVVAMGALLGDSHAFMVADLAFARLIVRATGNLAYELLFNSVVRTVEGNRGVELAFFANAKATLAVYARLLDRMEARDHERARATAARLLHRLDRTTVDALTMFLAAVPMIAPGAPIETTKKTKTRSKGSKKADPRTAANSRRKRGGR